MVNKLDSVVIVKNDFGSVATVRFEDRKDDKIFSSNSKRILYEMVESHVKQVLGMVVS